MVDSIIIEPQEALQDGCSGSIKFLDHIVEYDTPTVISEYDLYQATADAKEGWVFDHWEFKFHFPLEDIYYTGSSTSNPTERGDHYTFDFPWDGGQVWKPPYDEDRRIFLVELKAIFSRSERFTVSISASPQAGGIVTGGGEFDSGETCTLTAERNVGYELMRLENDADGITIFPPNPPQCFGKTITHSFEVTKDSSWIAYFRACTNAILRGKSGNILRGQGGNILRDW